MIQNNPLQIIVCQLIASNSVNKCGTPEVLTELLTEQVDIVCA
jgi:hypothetical protein